MSWFGGDSGFGSARHTGEPVQYVTAFRGSLPQSTRSGRRTLTAWILVIAGLARASSGLVMLSSTILTPS